MNDADINILQENYDKLRRDVQYDYISGYLIETHVLSLEMHEDINSERTNLKKMDRLLRFLPSRGGRAMEYFITSLKRDHRWVAEKLLKDSHNSSHSSNESFEEDIQSKLLRIPIQGTVIHEISKFLAESRRLSAYWNFLAHSMEVNPSNIENIRITMDKHGGVRYAIHQVLECWVESVGKYATIGKLKEHLEGEGFNNTAIDLVDFCRSKNWA